VASREPAARPIRFLALPFELMGGDDGLAFLAHSLPEAVSATLAGLRSLTVRSSLLAARLAEGPHDPRSIAEAADVDLLLTGRILCDGGRLQVTTELVDAPTATVAGALVCHSPRDGIFEIQDSLVRRIVELLASRLDDHESSALVRDIPTSARAYEYYLRGVHVERQRTIENMGVARDLFRQCLEEDPDYAPAWAHLGRCYRFLDKFGPNEGAFGHLADWAFRRAFALNPDLPAAHNHYTPVEADLGQAQPAMIRLLRQAGKHPNDPDLFSGLVQATRYCGLLDASVGAHRRARALDPQAVTSVAHTYFLMADYQRTLECYPPGGRYYLDAAALAAAGREGEAAALLRDRSSLAPLVESLRLSLAGDRARSNEVILRELDRQPSPDPERRFYLLRHLARNGEEAEALRRIEILSAGGFVCSAALRNDPWLAGLTKLALYPRVLDTVLRREAEARAAFNAEDAARSFLTVS
jgi:TolB-like protein